jgi:hypothetical protein
MRRTKVTDYGGIMPLLALITAIFSPAVAVACSPAKWTPQQIIENADLIVIANATRSRWQVWEYQPGVMGNVLSLLSELFPDDARTEGETKFEILRVLKGDAAEHVTVRHNVSAAACGVTFNSYDNYLLFVHEHKNKYFVNIFDVRPYLSEDEYRELANTLGIRADDNVKRYEDYLEPVDAR